MQNALWTQGVFCGGSLFDISDSFGGDFVWETQNFALVLLLFEGI